MKRREFIALLGGATAWPLAARAQQSEYVRRIGILMTVGQNDPDGKARNEAFLQALQRLGWTVGRNMLIDYRWSGGDLERIHKDAAELAALKPDVIVTNGAAGLGPLLQVTSRIPIVFVLVADPVGAGFVGSLAHPGGNATGFTAVEYGFGGKFLELLKEIAPGVTRAAVCRDPAISAGIGMFGAIQSAASSLSMEVVPIDVRDASGIEHAIAAFASSPNGGLIVTPSAQALAHRDLIVDLAGRYKLPGVYFARAFVTTGGLVSYNPNGLDQYRRAAHDGDDDDFGLFVGGGETMVKDFESRIVSESAQSGHVEHVADWQPTTVDAAMSFEPATVEVIRGETDEGGDLLAAHLAELRQQGDEGEGERGADALHRGHSITASASDGATLKDYPPNSL